MKLQKISVIIFVAMIAFNLAPLSVVAKSKTRSLEKKIFVHPRGKSYEAKPPRAGGPDKDKGNKNLQCYSTYGKEVKWKTTPDYVIDTTNNSGMTGDFVTNTFSKSVNTWDGEVDMNLNGGHTTGPTDWDGDTPDGRNEISFGSYSDNNTIAVTVIWGYFSGRPQDREIIEFDILFNNYFTWGNADSDSTLMDFENIAVHELGHGFGLEDMYESECSEVTMYGYSSEGEIKKRNLEPDDIEGINKVY